MNKLIEKIISGTDNKNSRFRIVYFFGLIIHCFYVIFFSVFSVPELLCFNIVSVSLYLFGAVFISKVDKTLVWLLILYAEIMLHGIMCSVFLGWTYGFGLYCMILIPVSFFVLLMDKSIKKPVLLSSVLSVIDIIVMTATRAYAYAADPIYVFPSEVSIVISCFNMIMSDIALLTFSVLFILKIKSDLSLLQNKNEELDMLANYDKLTGLRNRHNMTEIFESYEKSTKPYCISLGDIDDFKHVNDTYGHAAGDKVLIAVSNVIKKHVGDNGVVCRWGGEEILLILNGTTNECIALNEKIRLEIQNMKLSFERRDIRVTMTFGLCDYGDAMNIEKLISIADKRLYVGKGNGKNQVVSE